MSTIPKIPQVSVVVPTYNRCEYLRDTLQQLTVQEMRGGRFDFEVIVSDDGSTDGTFDVCQEFRGDLPLRYRYQEDVGFRASAARNGGARLATAPILVFLDTGTLAGPGFLQSHRDAHADGPASGCAVAGYTYGYRPYDPTPNLAGLLASTSPAQLVERNGADPTLWDWRHQELSEFDFDLSQHALPWMLFWSMNCSVRRDDFWQSGGFSESFHRWGIEDMEFGLRLTRGGVPIAFSRDAWAVEMPHARDTGQNLADLMVNLPQFLDMYRDPLGELTWAVFTQDELWPLERDFRALHAWKEKVRGMDVAAEIEKALAELPPVRPGRLAIFGAGDVLPPGLPDAEVIEFDDALSPDLDGDRHRLHHGIGLRTPLPNNSMDAVIITSRLAGLQDRWGARLLEEANRIGRAIWTPDHGTRQKPGDDLEEGDKSDGVASQRLATDPVSRSS